MFTGDVPFPVINKDDWWAGTVDALSAGQDLSFERDMFSQMKEVQGKAPHYPLSASKMQNSDYCNNADELKDCYMVFNTTIGEGGLYCEMMNGSRDCMDCTYILQCELCFDCSSCSNCYNLQSATDCQNCSDSSFLLQCRSCTHCFGCVNLRHREYCVFNEQKTKEEYEALMATLAPQSHTWRTEMLEVFRQFCLQHPRPHAVVSNVENVSGNQILGGRDIVDSYFVTEGEALKHCFQIYVGHHCQDYSIWSHHSEWIYECTASGNFCQQMRFCYGTWEGCSEMLYCQYCVSSSNCFGCSCLFKKQYCIFNKQYTKEEYEMLVPKIIEKMRADGQWGEFFPMEQSPYPYNHSMAQRYFTLTQEEVTARGLVWMEEKIPEAAQAIDPSMLPDALPELDDAIITRSTLSGKPFKITSPEIKRCKQTRVPLPRWTYDERMKERAKSMGQLHLYDRTCAKTGKAIQTIYPPDSPWIIWDRDVYEQEFGG